MLRRAITAASGLAICLLPLDVAQAQAQAGRYVVEWPPERQHLLKGSYVGTVRDGAREGRSCEFASAELDVLRDRRYAIRLRCKDDSSLHTRMHGTWWVDEIAGSCLILVRPGDEAWSGHHVYGFRIASATMTLQQDGDSCQAASERDRGMILHRRSDADASP